MTAQNTNQAIEHFDIAIVGGGLAGTTLALAIAQQSSHYKVAVIEPFSFDESAAHPSFDGRALALAYGSAKLFNQWQLWQDIQPHVGAIEQIQVSDAGHLGYTQLDCASHQLPALGYVIEAQVLGGLLAKRYAALCRQSSQFSLFCPEKVEQLTQANEQVTLSLSSGKQITSQLVIAADGADSFIRQQTGINQAIEDYPQVAITANVEVERTEHLAQVNTAYERFTESGPLAMLPMSNNRYGLVWCVNRYDAGHYLALCDGQFTSALQAKFGFKAGKISKVGKRASYPLKRVYAEQNYHHRCLLMANASHTLHPIAGQGLNLGLRDIASIVEVLANAEEQDIGLYSIWQQHLSQRQVDIDRLLTATDGLVRLFSNQTQPQLLARNASLLILNQLSWCKDSFAKAAMGL
ncbi:2-octaprenyl-6-methoxyphenyl hydroxylase [Catenovulum sp. SM1970]|uniref:2-octaprenyl-6-methoxyphenyl hydroxylase n=1 Tax=Marinifaba aquimaris TaxID=2741323 RepID=UPI0015739B29|nr:2-octaprenyl-6-methoxyphenyl hydroxylase [Marinifaba aquimaris]NTS77180.1 2-octaprenyl-6-methoxyphenyl hydroxylase [Marinifaba aquimaris]